MPRLTLTAKVIKAIVETMKTRKTTYAQAAGFAGIPKSTAMLWMQKAHEADARRDLTAKERRDLDLPTEAQDRPYVDLLDQTEQARYDAVLDLQDRLRAAAADDPKYWQAWIKYLTALDRETWGEKNRLELTGAEGGPVKTETDLSPAGIAALAAGLMPIQFGIPATPVDPEEDES